MSVIDTLANGIENVVGFFFEETAVARYVTVAGSAAGFTLPAPNGVNDLHVRDIHAPGVTNAEPTVIFFRTHHTGAARFSVRLNSTPLTLQALAADGPHSFHEVVRAGALLPAGNELVLAVAEGRVTFSDIVILYTSNRLTLRRPIVLEPPTTRP